MRTAKDKSGRKSKEQEGRDGTWTEKGWLNSGKGMMTVQDKQRR